MSICKQSCDMMVLLLNLSTKGLIHKAPCRAEHRGDADGEVLRESLSTSRDQIAIQCNMHSGAEGSEN